MSTKSSNTDKGPASSTENSNNNAVENNNATATFPSTEEDEQQTELNTSSNTDKGHASTTETSDNFTAEQLHKKGNSSTINEDGTSNEQDVSPNITDTDLSQVTINDDQYDVIIDHADQAKKFLLNMRKASDRSLFTPFTKMDKNTVIARDNNDSVHCGSLLSLQGDNRLTDEVINFYTKNVLRSYQEELTQQTPNRKDKVYTPGSFFISTLCDANNKDPKKRGKYVFNNCNKWLKDMKVFDEYASVILPIHVNHNHYTLIWVDLLEKRITHYDSMGGKSGYMGDVFRFIKDRYQYEKKYLHVEAKFDENEWSLVDDQTNVPQQNDQRSCGVFVCMFAHFIINGFPMIFQQNHVPEFRRLIAREILKFKV